MKLHPKKAADQLDIAPVAPVVADLYFQLITLDLIDDPEQPMRSDMTEASVEDLVISIRQVGIIEPLVVKPMNGRFEVIAGHRRLFSSRLAGLVEVPCYVRNADKEQTEMLKIHENMYRAEINPADEARHFSYLIDKRGMTPIKIAQLISKSVTYVIDRLVILNYPDLLRDDMMKHEITFTVAREFARFDDLAQMSSAVYYAKRGGMTGEMARKWVQDSKTAKEHPQVIQNTVYNDESGAKEVESVSQCVYCKEDVKLMQAEVVYMHSECLREANRATANNPLSK